MNNNGIPRDWDRGWVKLRRGRLTYADDRFYSVRPVGPMTVTPSPYPRLLIWGIASSLTLRNTSSSV